MGTPVKLFDYLSAGLPVVANDVSAWTKIITDNNVGIVTPDNPDSFANAIIELLENQPFREKCRSNALNLIKREYNWKNSAKKLLTIYEQLKS